MLVHKKANSKRRGLGWRTNRFVALGPLHHWEQGREYNTSTQTHKPYCYTNSCRGLANRSPGLQCEPPTSPRSSTSKRFRCHVSVAGKIAPDLNPNDDKITSCIPASIQYGAIYPVALKCALTPGLCCHIIWLSGFYPESGSIDLDFSVSISLSEFFRSHFL